MMLAKCHEPPAQADVLMIAVGSKRLPCLGYMIHRPFQRKGYGNEAAWSCINWIAGCDHRRAYTLIQPDNEPSMALVRKLEMQPPRNVVHAGLTHVRLARDAR